MFKDEKYAVQRRKWNHDINRRRKTSVLGSQADSTAFCTDKLYIYKLGRNDTDFCYLNKFYFTGTAYTKVSLADVFNRPKTTPRHWTTYKLIPEPRFHAYITIPRKDGRESKKWVKCYLYDEIMIMVYYINKIFETGVTQLHNSHPELRVLNIEVEHYRRQLKERLENGTDRITLL